MRPKIPFLFPRPRSVVQHGGAFLLPEIGGAICANSGEIENFLPAINAIFEKRNSPVRVAINDAGNAEDLIGKIQIIAGEIPSEGYEIIIDETGITIRAGDAQGAFYAMHTLAQMLPAADSRDLLCGTITDSPDLPVRGFMLDISRCKVPTMPALFELVDQLAALRINQFQLYIEHTFAFAEHEIVWRDASPVTAGEIRELDQFCRQRGIELVPNLQSFGHMDRWLKHAPYRHLAECPDGFFHDLLGAHRAAGVLKPDQESLDFIEKLYAEFLPNFSSRQFNIGGDEPWELGLGRSKSLCVEKGKHAVYRQHMRCIQKLVTRHGKKMQFWADALLEEPEKAGEMPANAVPVIWGYDAGHPFDAQCATLEKLGCEYLVAPGTSTWQSFHGRLDNALTNVNEAIRAALAHNAHGILITSWGDNGNHQPWFSMFPALASGAAQAWNYAGNATVDLAKGVAGIFLAGDELLAKRILAFGRFDDFFTKKIRNKSLLWEIFFAPPEKFAEVANGITGEEVRRATEALRPELIHSSKTPANIAEAELLSAVSMVTKALIKITGWLNASDEMRENGSWPFEFPGADAGRIEVYRKTWLLRARAGGLAESVSFIEKC